MFTKNWETSRRKYGIIEDRDVSIPVSDGIIINADIFRPDNKDTFPAILSVHQYNKKLQSAPIMPAGISNASGGIEAGGQKTLQAMAALSSPHKA
jgi:predicted acyl esterase